VLTGKGNGATGGPKRDIVALNAAAALVACGAAGELKSGVQLASDILDSGAALATLETFARTSQALAS
ncbi:MAG: anthranilate phosphoribosyltransferase, partial [Chloroflexota bacterium]